MKTAKLLLCGAVEGLYWPKWRLSDNQYPGAGRFKIEKKILKKVKIKTNFRHTDVQGPESCLGAADIGQTSDAGEPLLHSQQTKPAQVLGGNYTSNSTPSLQVKGLGKEN